MKNKTVSIWLAIALALSVGLISCGGGGIPEITKYNLTISGTEGGSVITPGEGTESFTYDEGEVVDLVAVAEEGCYFVSWTGDVDTIADAGAASTTIVMDADYTITANFEEWDAEELFAGGDGTEEDPYRIMNWHHLNNVRYFLSAHYTLMNDLDSHTAGYMELASLSANGQMGWEPIGDVEKLQLAFTGDFDGDGHEISGLFIDRPDEDNVGLFDSILTGAVIENLGIVNGSMTGNSNVGSIAGGSMGAINRSYSGESVSGKMCVGGLVGHNGGTVTNSYVTGNVSGDMYVGGLVAMHSKGDVSNSYVTGSVSGDVRVGALVGYYVGGSVNNSFWDTETSGQSTSDGGTGKTTAEMKNIATFSGAGWNITTVGPGERNTSYLWNIVDGQTYPFLSWQV